MLRRLTRLERLQIYIVDDGVFSLQPGTFSGLENLRNLILAELNLANVPLRLFNNTGSVESIELNSNMLTEIQPETFTGCCRQLVMLSLARNRIADIGSVSFVGMENLRKLDLHGNSITEIGEFDFGRNSLDLTELNLAKNGLRIVHEKAFDKLTKLTSLDLSGNALTNLGAGTFEVLRNLDEIDLSHNPWACNRDFYRTLEWLEIATTKWLNLTLLAEENTYCESPVRRLSFHDAYVNLKNSIEAVTVGSGSKTTVTSGMNTIGNVTSAVEYEFVTSQSDINQFVTNPTIINKSSTDKPSADQSVPGQSVTGQSVTGQSVSGLSVTEKKVSISGKTDSKTGKKDSDTDKQNPKKMKTYEMSDKQHQKGTDWNKISNISEISERQIALLILYVCGSCGCCLRF